MGARYLKAGMRRLVLGVVLSLAACSSPALAQEWSVVIGATGFDETTTEQTATLLASVRAQLEPHQVLAVRDTIRGVRAELPVTAVFGRALNLGATGAAVLQFHATDGPTAGYVHLWVSRLGGAPEERIEYVADISADLTAPARRFAATILSTLSRGAYYLVEVHVFTWPRDVLFSVDGSAPVTTSRPGREPGEGFNLWSGVRPAGTTEVRLFRTGYEDRVIRIEVPAGGAEPVRVPIEVSLTPSAP